MFYYNMINIRVLLIICVLIILKHFGDLNFECYIYIYNKGMDFGIIIFFELLRLRDLRNSYSL